MNAYEEQVKQVLDAHLESRELIGVHLHDDDPEAFIVGRVLAVGVEGFVLEKIGTEGRLDGVYEGSLDEIVRLQRGTAYLESLAALADAGETVFVPWRPEPSYRPENSVLYRDLLQQAAQDKVVVTLTAKDRSRSELSGFVTEVGDDWVEVEELDNDTGRLDGRFLLPLDQIASVTCMGKSEQVLLFRYRNRYGR